MNKKRKPTTSAQSKPTVIPHVEKPRAPLTAITSASLFAKPRTQAIQNIMSSMYSPQSGSSTTLQLFLAIQQETEAVREHAQRVYSQELENAKEIAEQRKHLIERAKRNPAFAATADEQIRKLPNTFPWQAQPPPSDIWSMMRTSEPMLRANGDVWQTIIIPAQVMFNSQRPTRINCRDDGALKVWQAFFDNETGVVPIDKWGLDCYLTVEQFGQWFPLEYWKDNELVGIATLEPTSLWIGHHLGMGYPPMSIVTPEAFDEAKWRDMQHDIAFSTFVNDLNVQTFPAFRIPLPPDVLSPVYAFGKKGFERYAIPHLARAYDAMMYRLMLSEYRQGILESWIAQVLMLVVKGWNNQPPSKGAVSAVQQMLESVIASHKGDMVVGYDVTPHLLKPESLDSVMGTDTWMEATQTIMRHLGIDLFIVSGEIAGTHGRGGGAQVEVSVQVAMERWKSLLVNYFHWCTHIARKYAEKNDKTLLKSLPSFQIGPSAYETQLQIERAIKPLFAAGILSPQTALERADESYAREIANFKEHAPNKHLMQPPATFAQKVVDESGAETTTLQQTPGRPEDVVEDEPRPPRARSSIQLTAQQKSEQDLRDQIAVMFAALLANPTREQVGEFTSRLEATLRAQMGAAYVEGYHQQGGIGEPDLALLINSPQGITFQIERLRQFKNDLLAVLGEPEKIGAMQHRAGLYAGALVYAYVMGTQAAATSLGATHWRRVLHPELSQTGPCEKCVADSAVIHPITEPFVLFHPSDVCSVQSISYQFAGNAVPLTVRIPPSVGPGKRIHRAPYGGNG